ncbi:MAG: hypothetical protein SGPRY_006589 [Prymnesium sp.]
MGSPIAANLIFAGHEVSVYDVNDAAISALVDKVHIYRHPATVPDCLTCDGWLQGAKAASSPRAVAMGADAVLTMLPDDKALYAVVTHPENGLLHSLTGVHISCSTIHPDTARDLALLHASHGSQFVGAPIFARADGVAARLASFVVSGDDEAIARVMPILEANSNGRATSLLAGQTMLACVLSLDDLLSISGLSTSEDAGIDVSHAVIAANGKRRKTA